MSIAEIPAAPSLEFYRKQARALLKALHAGDPHAASRASAHLPNRDIAALKLADAQWLIAREHGYASWPKFKQRIESLPQPAPAAAPARKTTQIGSRSVKERTGKDWEEWFRLLDDAGAAGMTHQEIVAIAREQGAGSWWQQMVAVTYEQARGLRVLNQSCEGDFQVSVSRTINAPADRVFDAWAEDSERAIWLAESGFTIRKATRPKSLRITVQERGNLDVMIYPKGECRCSCTADHKKLDSAADVERWRAYWSEALERLKQRLS